MEKRLFSVCFLILIFIQLNIKAQDSVVNCTQYSKDFILKEISEVQKKNKDIEDFLKGEQGTSITLLNIFGANFDLSQTNERILKNKELIKNVDGISNDNLRECAKKDIALYDSLKQISIEYLNLKIKLLEKNYSLNDSVRDSSKTENDLPLIVSKINQENENLKQLQNEFKQEIEKRDQDLNKNKRSADEIILVEDLSKLKMEILASKIENNTSLEAKINYFKDINNEINQLWQTFHDSKNYEEKVQIFENVEKLWKTVAKENYYDLISSKANIEVRAVPSLSRELASNIELKKLYDEVSALRLTFLKLRAEKKFQELRLLNQLIVSCSALRSSLYKELGPNYFWKGLFSLDIISKLRNELIFSPYRIISYFYSKYLAFIEKVEKGRSGYLEIITGVLKILLLLVPFAMLKLFFTKIDNFIQSTLRSLMSRYGAGRITLFANTIWQKFRDSSAPAMWLLLLYGLKKLEDAQNIIYLINVLEIYLISKIIINVIIVYLGSISRIDMTTFSTFKTKSEETAKKFKNIFLFYFYTMLFIETTVGYAYLYSVINYLVVIYSVVNLAKESMKWVSEFEVYMEKKFSGVITKMVFNSTSKLPNEIRSVLLLIFILILSVVDLLIGYTENFEISKKLSANLFKKQIENIEAEEGADEKISQTYKDLFSIRSLENEDVYVVSDNQIEKAALNEISEWLEEKSDEHSVVIYGDKGSGKTTLIKYLGNKMDLNRVEVKYSKIPRKITKKEELYSYLRNLFGIESGDLDIHAVDNNVKKPIVVILDEVQNIFLSKTGGFESYYTLIDIINQSTKNIFWVMSFNKYSWLYLDRAFGRAQFFRNVFELKGWSDIKIKELIMARHEKSGYRLSYDLLISATSSEDEIDKYASIESKFFKLLWEVSRGNPRCALLLWISALSRKNVKTFNVNVPKFSDVSGLDKLGDEIMFVLADVLKHENLTSKEIEETTNLASGLVRNSIKIGLERRFLYRDDNNRYMIDLTHQFSLIKYLKLKNFIYGN